MFSRLRAPLLQNTGSTARDHLASERTFLAWLRTGLGFVALGVAVERFSQLDLSTLESPPAFAEPSSSAVDIKEQEQKSGRERQTQGFVTGLIATGSGSVVYGAGRYFDNMRCLERGVYKPSFYGVGGLSVAVLGLTGLVGWGLVRDAKGKKDV